MNSLIINNSVRTWRNAAGAFLVVLILVLFLYRNTFLGMVSIWTRSETFTHGFLVVPIVIWLIWRKRRSLVCEIPQVNFLFLIPIAAVAFFWLLGDLVSINSVTQVSATAISVFLVFLIFGSTVTSIIIFPLFFIFFAVPLGEFLLPILMEWTAKFTVIAIRLSGIPVYQEGLQFIISSGSWSVVEACSGVRYLISSVMIGTLYAYLNYQSFKRRFIFICISVIVPVFANWMRAYFIVMLGHISGNKLAVGFDHLIYGWLFFGLVVMLMFFIGGHWAEDFHINENNAVASSPNKNIRQSTFWYAALIASIVVAAPVFWSNFISEKNNSDLPVLKAPIKLSSDWSISADSPSNLISGFSGASSELNSIYSGNVSKVGLYIAYYRNQNYEKKLISSDNSFFSTKDKNWLKLESNNYLVKELNNSFGVQKILWRNTSRSSQSEAADLQVWQFYWVDGLFTENDYKAKIYGALQRLLGKGDDSAAVFIYTEDDGDGLAKKKLGEFLDKNLSEIKVLLEKAREN
jgi:exosortase A